MQPFAVDDIADKCDIPQLVDEGCIVPALVLKFSIGVTCDTTEPKTESRRAAAYDDNPNVKACREEREEHSGFKRLLCRGGGVIQKDDVAGQREEGYDETDAKG